MIEAIAAIAAGAVFLGLLVSAIHGFELPSARVLVGAYGVYTLSSLLVVRSVGAGHPFDHFGAPNGVTLARLVLGSVFGGIALDLGERPLPDAVAWSVLAVTAFALALDGLDGVLARARDQESPFGARFDMEVDALLILLLALLAWLQAKAGPWVLVIGALRYGFVAAGWLWPILARPLPPSFRRKAVCVVQGVSLAVLLAPVVQSPASDAIAGMALLFILYSFAVDVIWLASRRHEA